MERVVKHIPGYIQDGKLDARCGRIVTYDGCMVVSHGPSADHNYLLRALSSRYKINRDEVISNAARLYWRIEDYGIAVSGVRKIDDEYYDRRLSETEELIRHNLRKHI